VTDPRFTFQLLPVPAAVALIVTALIAYVLGRRLSLWPAVLVAGLALPMLVVGIGIYHAATTAADDAPRGSILVAALCVAAAVTPLTLMVSRFAVGYARR
jgi:hypothetical protein